MSFISQTDGDKRVCVCVFSVETGNLNQFNGNARSLVVVWARRQRRRRRRVDRRENALQHEVCYLAD